MSQDPDKFIEDMIEEASRKGPKNQKSSARQKYNRRKNWLNNALQQMNHAIDELLAQEGTVYKRGEIDALKAAIDAFYDKSGLEKPELHQPTQEGLDNFMDMLNNNKPWEPPSKEEMARIFAEAGLSLPPDHEE